MLEELTYEPKFYFEYQPILNLKTNIYERYEVFVRVAFNQAAFCDIGDIDKIASIFHNDEFNEILYAKLLKDLDILSKPVHFNLMAHFLTAFLKRKAAFIA